MNSGNSHANGLANKITGPNVGGRRQLPIPTSLTARAGQFCRSAESSRIRWKPMKSSLSYFVVFAVLSLAGCGHQRTPHATPEQLKGRLDAALAINDMNQRDAALRSGDAPQIIWARFPALRETDWRCPASPQAVARGGVAGSWLCGEGRGLRLTQNGTSSPQKMERTRSVAQDEAEAAEGEIVNRAVYEIHDLPMMDEVAYACALRLVERDQAQAAADTAKLMRDASKQNEVLSRIAKGGR